MQLCLAHRPRFGCFTFSRTTSLVSQAAPQAQSLEATGWTAVSVLASSPNQPRTSHFAPHSALLMTPTRLTETGIQPLFCSHTLPCFAATLFSLSLHYAPSCRLAAAHMIRASTQPPVLPGHNTQSIRRRRHCTVQASRKTGSAVGLAAILLPENTTPVLPPDTHPLLRLPIFSLFSKLTDCDLKIWDTIQIPYVHIPQIRKQTIPFQNAFLI